MSIFGAMLLTAVSGLMTMEKAPPYPAKIVSSQAEAIFSKADILKGQSTFQEYGLMDLGSVWGHGTYRGADFTAETLHQVGVSLREFYSIEKFKQSYQSLNPTDKAVADQLAINDIKTNRYNESTDTLTLSTAQTYALKEIRTYYNNLFNQGDPQKLIAAGTIKAEDERIALADFFFWTAWASGTLRPDADYTYTNNWPGDRSVGNGLSTQATLWTFVSILMYMAFLGLIIWIFHNRGFTKGESANLDLAYSLANSPVSVSQVKTAKYFLIAVALFLVQTLVGGYM
ncbi:MAG TPA: hypothetical protein VNU93_03045, partial [Verrucomicrobiae bacterium]|nr:hypothetical protein [Verrucomicrobiae bacterium]